jgi:hypothetical protein
VPQDVLCYFAECQKLRLSGNIVTQPRHQFRKLTDTRGTVVKPIGLHNGIQFEQ